VGRVQKNRKGPLLKPGPLSGRVRFFLGGGFPNQERTKGRVPQGRPDREAVRAVRAGPGTQPRGPRQLVGRLTGFDIPVGSGGSPCQGEA
jgi:hypothetical protein